ncbi:hypothetical protein [Acidipila rosea]|uniref:Uncharacterized protein n=1 Tax=Acidipila rosea TaxID=768535 RepID=A0A4R1LCU3_9BACT|nr:hypothetical protein [Acidipila rosea]MBW4026978.1 hypothetical protein [Acidobacteriota bacterium]MBW4045046.1 hypothetical protein [Acidobacteriota bacterium]TCK75280.1 hypothetical protein C7378_0260 [Acidipila rosea]
MQFREKSWAAAAFILSTALHMQLFAQSDRGAAWLLRYQGNPAHALPSVNALIQDKNFLPFLNDRLKMSQHFWKPGEPVSQVVKDYLAVPGDVLTDGTTYYMADGCVQHFCPNKGLLWVDLTTSPATVVFAATDMMKNSNQWSLYLFTSGNLSPATMPQSLRAGITRWTSKPLGDGHTIEPIGEAIVIDGEGMEHRPTPLSLGVNEIASRDKAVQ